MILKEKSLLALDGKMLLDDNALFRHPDLAEMRDVDEEAGAETEATEIRTCPLLNWMAILAAWSMAQDWR